jgi:hypothetical protein
MNDPEDSIKHKVVVGRIAFIWGTDSQNELFKGHPLLARIKPRCETLLSLVID